MDFQYPARSTKCWLPGPGSFQRTSMAQNTWNKTQSSESLKIRVTSLKAERKMTKKGSVFNYVLSKQTRGKRSVRGEYFYFTKGEYIDQNLSEVLQLSCWKLGLIRRLFIQDHSTWNTSFVPLAIFNEFPEKTWRLSRSRLRINEWFKTNFSLMETFEDKHRFSNKLFAEKSAQTPPIPLTTSQHFFSQLSAKKF